MPNNFTIQEIEELQRALDHLFDQKTFPLTISSQKIQKILEKDQWVNSSDLLGDLKKITDSKSLAEIQKNLSARKSELEAKPIESTVPPKEQLEKFKEEAEKRKAQEEESKITAKAKTQQFIKSQKKLYLNLPKDLKTPEITAEEEIRLRALIDDKVKPNPTFFADSLAKEIVKQNTRPEMTKDQIKGLEANAKLIAVNYTDKLFGLESKNESVGNVARMVWAQNPIHAAASLVNSNNPLIGEKTARSAQITALTLEHDHLIAKNLLSKVADPKILRFFYPGTDELIIFEISDKPDGQSVISVNKEAFTDQGVKLGESNNQILELIKDNAWGEIKNNSWRALDKTLSNTPWYSKIKSLVPDFLKPNVSLFAAGEISQPSLSLLWSNQGIKLIASDLPTLLSSSFSRGVLLTPSFNFQFGTFAISQTIFTTAEGLTGQALGINIGNFGITLIKGGGEKGLQLLINLGIKAATPAVTGATAGGGAAAGAAGGLSGTLAGIMATLGVWGTPILMAIGAVIGWLVGKLLGPIINWIQKHQEDLKIIGLIMLGGGMIMRSIPLMVTGGLIFVPIALRSGLSMAGIAARTAFLFGRIGASMAITIGTPIIVAIVVFPILVAIILFIINSGAYLVPPRSGPFGPTDPTACTQNKIPINFPVASSSREAQRGWQIVSDLYQGFWCYWNRSPGDSPEDTVLYPPSYPELFDENLFRENPFPSVSQVQTSGESLFWCTWLIQKAFRETGNNSLAMTLWSPTMFEDFLLRGKMVLPMIATRNNVPSGSVVFFRVHGESRINHVGMVHSVSQDGISFIQSNAPTKEGFIAFNAWGIGVQDLPNMEIVGFGKP